MKKLLGSRGTVCVAALIIFCAFGSAVEDQLAKNTLPPSIQGLTDEKIDNALVLTEEEGKAVSVESLKGWLSEIGLSVSEDQLKYERGLRDAKVIYDKLELGVKYPGPEYARIFVVNYWKSYKTAEKSSFKKAMKAIKSKAARMGKPQSLYKWYTFHWLWGWIVD